MFKIAGKLTSKGRVSSYRDPMVRFCADKGNGRPYMYVSVELLRMVSPRPEYVDFYYDDESKKIGILLKSIKTLGISKKITRTGLVSASGFLKGCGLGDLIGRVFYPEKDESIGEDGFFSFSINEINPNPAE